MSNNLVGLKRNTNIISYIVIYKGAYKLQNHGNYKVHNTLHKWTLYGTNQKKPEKVYSFK